MPRTTLLNNRVRATVAAAAACTALACAPVAAQATSNSTAATGPSAAAPASTSAPAAVRLPGVACPQLKAVVRPTHVPISCGDGSAYVIHVHWFTLTATRGTAKGIVLLDDCVPNCAAGHYQAYGSRLTFSHVRTRHGVPVFGRLVVRFTTRHPDHQTRMVATY